MTTISQRFWYHGGDWFYEVEDELGFKHARYQFTEDMAYKLVNGLQVAFEPGELDNLIANVKLYYENIRKELYTNAQDDVNLAA